MLTLLLPLVAIVGLFAILLRARRGDGRTDLRRCPKCWYAMDGNAGLTCPECGKKCRSEAELFQRRSYRFLERSATTLIVLTTAFWLLMLLPGPWTQWVPHFGLRIALRLAAPYHPLDINVATPLLTQPDANLHDSKSGWERLVWQQQVNNMVWQWSDAVLASSGAITDAELARLVPLAEETHKTFIQTGWMSAREAWLIDDATAATTAMRTRLLATPKPDVSQLLRIDWVLSELHYEGADYSHRPDWALVPDQLIVQSLGHADPKVRLFGLDRAGKRAQLSKLNPKLTFPKVAEQIRQMAAADADAAVRARAKDLVPYLEAFNIK